MVAAGRRARAASRLHARRRARAGRRSRDHPARDERRLHRAVDRIDSGGPGLWTTTALPPAGGMLGNVTPYFIESAEQFRPAPPPAYLSPSSTRTWPGAGDPHEPDAAAERDRARLGVRRRHLHAGRLLERPGATYVAAAGWTKPAARGVRAHGRVGVRCDDHDVQREVLLLDAAPAPGGSGDHDGRSRCRTTRRTRRATAPCRRVGARARALLPGPCGRAERAGAGSGDVAHLRGHPLLLRHDRRAESAEAVADWVA
jgi:hypothetical protein